MTTIEWVESIDPEGFYLSKELGDDLRKETGAEPCWPTHGLAFIKSLIANAPGLGGGVDESKPDEPIAWGREVIESVILGEVV